MSSESNESYETASAPPTLDFKSVKISSASEDSFKTTSAPSTLDFKSLKSAILFPFFGFPPQYNPKRNIETSSESYFDTDSDTEFESIADYGSDSDVEPPAYEDIQGESLKRNEFNTYL